LELANVCLTNEIHSLRHALTILESRETRRWIRPVALISAGMLKSSDLVLSALVRARFCELLSPKAPKAESDLFLVGLVSLMDAILEVPMADVFKRIPPGSAHQGSADGRRGAAAPH